MKMKKLPNKTMSQKKSEDQEGHALWQLNKDALLYRLRYYVIENSISVLPELNDQLTIRDITLEHPADEKFGDYSTNIAFKIAGRVKMPPPVLAEKIATKINENLARKSELNQVLEKAEVVGGFINLWFKKSYFIKQIDQLLREDYGSRIIQIINEEVGITLAGKKIAVEYTDPNPFKEFHLGHLYSNVIGESISRLLEINGAKVWRGDFYGDVGMHVAKSVWGMMKKMEEKKLKIQDLEKLSIGERQKFLGEGYAMGVRKYEDDPQVVEEIKDINYLIYVAAQELLKKSKGWRPIIDYKQYVRGKEDKLKDIEVVYEAGLRWSLEYFETIYKKLGTKFDGYYPESWVGEYGMKLVDKGLKQGILEKSEGAIVFKGEKYGLHTRVFVNKLGLPTYETKDLGLAYAKYQDFKYDFSINVFGKEIDEYYKVVKVALSKIDPMLGKRAHHIAHGMVKLPEGKMSSRTGNVVTFEWLLTEATGQSLKIMEDVKLNKEAKRTTAEAVGLGAVKYALLKSSPGDDVVFDFERSISFEGDSGPYLQYTYARTQSVLRRAAFSSHEIFFGDAKRPTSLNESLPPKQKIDSKFDARQTFSTPQKTHASSILASSLESPAEVFNYEELSILRWLYRYAETVQAAGYSFSPNLICSYLFELAQRYNLFYQKHRILGTGVEESASNFRLLLTKAVGQVLKSGLTLLGITPLKKM